MGHVPEKSMDTDDQLEIQQQQIDNGRNDGEKEEKEEEEELYFEGSTHQFAIYWEPAGSNSVSLCYIIKSIIHVLFSCCFNDENEIKNESKIDGYAGFIGYLVIIMQFVLYGVCAKDVTESLTGTGFTIPVNVQFGKRCNREESYKNLICPPDLPDLQYVAIASVLLAFFIMPDILAGLRIMAKVKKFHSKFAAFLIVVEALFAALIAALFAVKSQGPYDAIANCVGILFIHDADEKAFEAYSVLKNAFNPKNSIRNDNYNKDSKQGFCKGELICCCCLDCVANKERCTILNCCCNKIWCNSGISIVGIFTVTLFIMSCTILIGFVLRELQKSFTQETYGDDYWNKFFSDGYYEYNFDYDYDSSYYHDSSTTTTN